MVWEMGELKIKISKELEGRMERFEWVNWPSVALKAFSERLDDMEELELERKAAQISEIPADDNREVKESLAKEVVKSTEVVLKELKSGSKKTMTLDEFNNWCDDL